MNNNIKMADALKTMPDQHPEVDVATDLVYKKNYMLNSFFATGRFLSQGHTLTYLLHLMPMNQTMIFCFSVTDETEKKYVQFSKAYPLAQAEISQERFLVRVPAGSMEGDLSQFHFEAQMERAALHLDLVPVGYPIYNGGTGKFHLMNLNQPGLEVYEYSLPRLISNGSIELDGKLYPIRDGITWYDRQWQVNLTTLAPMLQNPEIAAEVANLNALMVWGWMNLSFSEHDDQVSVWLFKESTGPCWATVLEPDGTHRVTEVQLQTSDPWQSPASGNVYPMIWQLKIPTLDAELTVKTILENQELFFSKEETALNHYEGTSTFTGRYRGQPASGYCCLELLGNWD